MFQDLAAARRTPWGGAGFELFDSKLHPPVVRAAIVPRPALVERLIAMPEGSVVSIVAPAGYGKSTLLAQWAEYSAGRIAWLSLDERDNDPETLLAYLAAALNRVDPVEPEIFRRRRPGSLSIPDRRACATGHVVDATVTLSSIRTRSAAEPGAEMSSRAAVNLPTGAKLAIASRDAAACAIAPAERRDHGARRR